MESARNTLLTMGVEKMVRCMKKVISVAFRHGLDRAKGLLMKSRGFSEAEAYNVLRNKAMQGNVKLAEVAQRIIDMADLLG